jgi:FlaA1/EpsC-like NDP-sugar epimerase
MYNKEYNILEKKFISKQDRFKLSKSNISELKNDFRNSKILITGAAGSIGNVFVKRLNQFNFKELYLMDKDENQLTELNRELLLFNEKFFHKIKFICVDINLININRFIMQKKITHYLNFAAIKHVRSEENIETIKYMFLTNSENFLFVSKLPKKKKLKKVFSISTDKSVNPSSILGVSKKIMEQRLCEFKKNNKNIFVSTARFANVSFSNGSILKSIVDRINQKKIFGIPDDTYRFFITHEESSSLCLKSLLSVNNNSILIPDKKTLKRMMTIKELCSKILEYKGFEPQYVLKRKKTKNKKKYIVILNKSKTHGQKGFEELYEKSEKLSLVKDDFSIRSLKLLKFINTNTLLNKIGNCKNKKDIINIISKQFINFSPNKKVLALSKII